MRCPVCDETLREIEKGGVRMEICTGCKGAWLERATLETLMGSAGSRDREVDVRPAGYDDRGRGSHDSHDRDLGHHDEHDDRESHGGERKKKKGSWLGDIIGGIGGED